MAKVTPRHWRLRGLREVAKLRSAQSILDAQIAGEVREWKESGGVLHIVDVGLFTPMMANSGELNGYQEPVRHLDQD